MPTFPKNLPSHFPKSKKEEQEFGKGKKDILICRECDAVYWYKSWHHSIEDYPELKEAKNVDFTICPACLMIKEGKFEGEIILENVPEDLKKEIKNLAENFGKRAFEKDPMDRVISIKEIEKGKIQILTTENQLTQRLAKKIKQTFGQKTKLTISHSKRESTLRAKIIF
jgi:hypothetical protein